MRVAMVTTHPIQYQVPWLRMLGARKGIDLQVFFAMIPDAAEQGREFGVAFQWDTPLLDGYRHTLLENRSRRPSLTQWSGCDTPGIGDALRAGRFDAVIVNGWGSRTAVQALLACRRQGIPCIVRGEVNGVRRRDALRRLGHRLLIHQYAACLAIGRHNRAYYRAMGVAESRIFDTPYCVDNAHFAAAAASALAQRPKHALRRAFGLEAERTTFLFSGKFVDKKRPADALQALAALSAEARERLQLLMVGDGPLRSALEEQARGLPVVFTGFLNQSRIAEAYAASDCLLLPSDAGETWGLVVNEAMACGLPAIVSDQVGCAPDLVEGHGTGAVHPCGDVQALAALLADLGGSPERLAAWGEAARRRVSTYYCFERVVAGVLECLQFVRGGG